MKAKLPHFNSFFKVYSQKKTMQYQLLNQSKMQISANLFFFSEGKAKKNLLNLNPYKSPGAENLHPRILKELSVKFINTLIYLNSKSYCNTGRNLWYQI